MEHGVNELNRGRAGREADNRERVGRRRRKTWLGRGGLAVAGLSLIAALPLVWFGLNGSEPRALATPVCANVTVIPAPAEHPALVADCDVLLALKDELRGTAALNWDAATALGSWDGVMVESVAGVRRVSRLDMDGLGLDGVIPPRLAELDGLLRLKLAWGNSLSGGIPPELGRLRRLT